jgi:SAM-dependent methyltransferase
MYQGILERPADEAGLNGFVHALRAGVPLSQLLHDMIGSPEFLSRHPIVVGRPDLPDLTVLYPQKYVRKSQHYTVFKASSDEDFNLLESLIVRHRFYDNFDVYSPRIDIDKQITAAVIESLGAKSCLDLGCFTGAVISLLESRGLSVCGVDISHMAFVLAYNNIRSSMRYGDLLDQSFETTFDCVCAMDVLEHINPGKVERYVARIAELISPTGFGYINGPMFGQDDVFGKIYEPHLPEWEAESPDGFWHHLECDHKGWPVHGHLIFAGPRWWENLLLKYGLVRERQIETCIHSLLGSFYDKLAAGRHCLFVVRHASARPDIGLIRNNLQSIVGPLARTV